MEKRNVSIRLSDKLIDKLNSFSREEIPNKSELIESLIWKWIEGQSK